MARSLRIWFTMKPGCRALLLALLLAVPGLLAAAPGDLDPTFGMLGRVTTDFVSSADAFALAVQPDGKLVVGGTTFDGTNIVGSSALVRYHADGSLDRSFGIDGRAGPADASLGELTALTILRDGRIVEAGWSIQFGNGVSPITSDRARLARYNPDGTVDTTFGDHGVTKLANPNLFGNDAIAAALAVQPDGKLVIAGPSDSSVGVFRCDPDGHLDPTFGSGGSVFTAIGTYAAGRALVVQPNGTIVVAGSTFSTITGSDPQFALARYHADGSLDPTFGTAGIVTTPSTAGDAFALARQPDGRLVVGGAAGSSPYRDFKIARFDADGSLDPTFGTGGTVTIAVSPFDDTARAIALQTDGKIVVAGYAKGTGGWALVRLQSDGTLDPTFGTGGLQTTNVGLARDQGLALAIDASANLVVAGTATVDGARAFGVARYLSGDVSPAVCGNGVEESPEQCDDGEANGTDGCCTTSCRRIDQDGDGICDRDDACTLPARIAAPRLALSHGTGANADELRFTGTVRLAARPAYDPLLHGLRLRIREATATVVDVTLPGVARQASSPRGWRKRGATTTWVDRTANPIDGIAKVVLHRRPGSRRVRFVVRGRNGSYPASTLPLTALIVLDPTRASTGQCGEIAFGTRGTSCASTPRDSTITCR
jgi:uncharacterized delta-60 repeat protein